jgi:hypothetical protein
MRAVREIQMGMLDPEGWCRPFLEVEIFIPKSDGDILNSLHLPSEWG